MSDQDENILSRKITGLTWGVMLTIIGVFGGGAVAGVAAYVNIVKQLTTVVVIVEQMSKAQDNNHKDDGKKYDDLSSRVCNIENKMIPQAK